MRDEIVYPIDQVQAEFERQLGKLQEELAAATTRRGRSKVRRDIRRLNRHIFNRQITTW